MTTDPAVTAAAEAMCDDMLTRPWDRTTPCPAHMRAAEVVVAAARPIIEAERDEHWRNDDTIRDLLAIHEAVVRERIAADIEEGCVAKFKVDGPWVACASCRHAARIARGNA